MIALIAVRIVYAGRAPLRLWLMACVLSVLPDADAALHHSGVPYSHPFGHRGFTHSFVFAALAAAFAACSLFRERRWRIWLFLSAVGVSHGVIDAMTDGGLGIAFFAPLDNARYFLPWRPLVVSPIGVTAFFSDWGVAVLRSEIVHVWLPLCGLLLVVEAVRWRRRAGALDS